MPTEARYEMLWDCPACGTSKLLGLTHRHCPGCGSPQDASKRYFPPPGEEVAVENHPFQGRDKLCAGCDTPNAASAGFCTSCGAPLDGSKEVRTRDEQKASPAGFAADSARAATEEHREARRAEREGVMAQHAEASGHAAPPPLSPGKGGMAKWVVLAGAVVLAVFCGVFLFWKKEAAVAVSGHAWERSIEVETLALTQQSAWKEQVPAGAQGVSCRQEQRETRQVQDGQTCVDKRQDKGDGSFAVTQECTPNYRSEPVYGEKCSYTALTWTVSDTKKAAGKGVAPAPSWPAVSLGATGNFVGAQREGKRSESYTLHLVNEADKSALSCTLPESKWSSMADGSRWKAQVGVISGALDCTAMAPM